MFPIYRLFAKRLRPHQSERNQFFIHFPLILAVALTVTGSGSAIQAATINVNGLGDTPGNNGVATIREDEVSEDFGVKEYDEFHRVLHHLEHEALPKNDIATIRNRAKELIKLGDAIVKLGVPAGTKSENVDNFKKELERFKQALVKYGSDAESASDADLKAAYSVVHESFEELAGMLPRK
jgi:hypothetical protein